LAHRVFIHLGRSVAALPQHVGLRS